jgi:hypothetical protein
MMKHIEAGWQSYLKLVVPAGASPVQISETRQAFYAGAAILMQKIMLIMDEDREPTAQDMKHMADIQAELDEFGQQIDRRFFGPQPPKSKMS